MAGLTGPTGEEGDLWPPISLRRVLTLAVPVRVVALVVKNGEYQLEVQRMLLALRACIRTTL